MARTSSSAATANPPPAGAKGPTVRLAGLYHSYGSVTALNGIAQKVEAGSFVALVGLSGSGKSTLLKTVNRLVAPDSGQVLIDGIDNCESDLHRLRRSIGYVFQNIGLFPHLDVARNIGIGAGIRNIAPLGEARIAELLEQVDLPASIATRMPGELSGGQQQRVGVARALAHEPGLMLMDEPFGALDPITRELIGNTYRAIHDRLGLTTLMVTHDMAEALLLADRIWVMADGRIVADATPQQLLLGACGAEAEALVAIPRAQAEKLVAMCERATADRPA